ncbi:MarR family winged helix-turn-helix transcriptional regulator [uncultured Lactobacillus sp.]|uniref:MarR family winged helix-turn-helix transcriptional regulator n=1 Tax=uncultured Lactobacillus sp. TaxID=153152 RepID=UPI0025846C93|nr:MarR family winged helix-turn-helix transcriptional regulator [uncultured Lactobacillus sp.]
MLLFCEFKTEGTIGLFLTKISNEVEKQMDDDLKSFGISANELEVLIELRHHKNGKSFSKLAKEIHVTDEKLKQLISELEQKNLITVSDNTAVETDKGIDLCKKIEKHREDTDQTITGMLSKDETLGLVKVLKKMLKSSEDKD